MAAVIDIDKPTAQQSRTELTLSRIAQAWSRHELGSAFVQPLLDFLRALPNRETLRAYSYSVLELFDWYDKERGRISSPPEVTRVEAVAYARWLSERTENLTSWQLKQDPARSVDKIIHDYLRRRPGASSDELRTALLQYHWLGVIGSDGRPILKMDHAAGGKDGLSKHLACMVRAHTIRRTPSLGQLRRLEIAIPGWEPDAQRQIGLTAVPPASIFRYWIIENASGASERSSTVSLRLAALSSLWEHFMRAGENIGRGTLLTVNVWRDPLNAVRSQVQAQQAATRAEKTPDASLLVRMLATTFPLLGPRAAEAATAVLYGGQVDEPEPAFADVRDRALMLFMVQAGGPRVGEATRLRKRDIAGEPPIVTIVGKRNRKRQLRVPPAAMGALRTMWLKLQRMAYHQKRYFGRSRAEILLLDDGSPLFPVVSHWGANNHANSLSRLSRQAVAMMLRRRAIAAGVVPTDPLFRRVHPHGLRHLFAQMAKGSTPITKIQAMMGHASLTTTGRYTEERASETLIAEVFSPPAVSAPDREVPPIREEIVTPALPTRRRIPEVVQAEQRAPGPARPAESKAAAPTARRPPVSLAEPPRKATWPEGPETKETAPAPSVEPALALPEEAPQAELRPAEDWEAIVGDLMDSLARIYETDWGEKGSRTSIAESQFRPRAGLSVGAVFSELAEETMPEVAGAAGAPAIVETSGAKRLARCYRGASGMIWWAGTNGELVPEMPVLSRRQVGQCDAGIQGLLCSGLVSLWMERMETEPTAAAALVMWIGEAIDTAGQVDGALGGARWIAHEEPAAYEEDVREHDLDRVLGWFRENTWNYRSARGREQHDLDLPSARVGRVIGSPLSAPPWYAEADPIASLPREDRLELLDLVGTLTLGAGHRMLDETRRYGRWSRVDVSAFILAMAHYDDAVDRLATHRASRRRKSATEEAEESARVAMERHLQAVTTSESLVAELARRAGVPDFDIRKATLERRTAQKVAAHGRERRGQFYLRLAGLVFGEAVSRDPMLAAYAKTIPSLAGHSRSGEGEAGGRVRAGGGEDITRAKGTVQSKPILSDYADLFTVDRRAGTISHARTFKQSFAEQHGTHSECVARRTARHIWELWSAHNAVLGDASRLAAHGVSEKDAVKWLRGERLPVDTAARVSSAAAAAGVLRYRVPENVAAFDRRDYIASLVATMGAYLIPCPASQEAELRALLPEVAEPRAVYETWRRFVSSREKKLPGREGPSEAEQLFAELAAQYQRNYRQTMPRYTQNASRSVPSPVLLVFAARPRTS